MRSATAACAPTLFRIRTYSLLAAAAAKVNQHTVSLRHILVIEAISDGPREPARTRLAGWSWGTTLAAVG